MKIHNFGNVIVYIDEPTIINQYRPNLPTINWSSIGEVTIEGAESFLSALQDAIREAKIARDDIFVSDGFGNSFYKRCQACDGTMEIVRPGKAQCSNCGR